MFAGVMMRDLLLGLMNVLGPSFSLAFVSGPPSLSLCSGGASHLQPHRSVRICLLLVLLSGNLSQHQNWAVLPCTNSNAAQRRAVPDQA